MHPSFNRRRWLFIETLAVIGAAFLSLGGIAGCCCSHKCMSQGAQNTAPGASAAASGTENAGQTQSGMPQPGQETFASPQDAASALKMAVDAGSRHRLVAIFGDEGRQLIFSGDRVQETNGMNNFATHLGQYMHLDQVSPDKAVLHVGQQNWPFPIPIVQSNGQWFYDTAAGKEELLNRRIGEDELTAIDVCRAYVQAQKEYAQQPRVGNVIQYAQHFMSTAGTKDGLYWPEQNGQLSPMGPLVAQARLEGYTPGAHAESSEQSATQPAHRPHPYHGYIFHILKSQGENAAGGKMDYLVDGKMTKGFALIAFPDKWDSSGVMTFLVNQDGKVYQKNLGPQTREIAQSITEYNPDNTWQEVKD